MTYVPDAGIKNTTIEVPNLPKITKDGTYVLRYRIVSEDKTVTSAWSPHRVIQSIPVFSTTSTHKTILNPNGTSPAKYEISVSPKSHGKSFDVSWKINNVDTDLVEVPKQLNGMSYDSYVRWGTKVISVSGPVSGVYTIETELMPQVPSGEIVILESIADDVKIKFTTTSDSTTTTFTATTLETIPIGTTFSLMWTPWEYISTTTGNSFSVPIPESHQSTIVAEGSAEFMVHISTTTKDLDENNYKTRLFYSEHISTKGFYDSTALPSIT